jgi:hypothetical protein
MFKATLGLNKTSIDGKLKPKTDDPIPKEMIVNSKNLPKDPIKFSQAISQAKQLIKEGKNKIETSKAVFPLIRNEDKEVIHQVFMEGCGLTEKGAMTYRYNLIRSQKKYK